MMLRRSPLLSLLLSPNRHPSGRPSFVLVLRQTSLLCCVYPWLSPVYPFGSDDVAVAPHFPAAAKRRSLKGQNILFLSPRLENGVLLLSKAVDFSRRRHFTDVSEFICALHSWIRNRGYDVPIPSLGQSSESN